VGTNSISQIFSLTPGLDIQNSSSVYPRTAIYEEYRLPHITLLAVTFISRSTNPTISSDLPIIFLSTYKDLIFPVWEITHLSTYDPLQSPNTTYLFSSSSSYIHLLLLIGQILSKAEW
jgi:hypothetical protein